MQEETPRPALAAAPSQQCLGNPQIWECPSSSCSWTSVPCSFENNQGKVVGGLRAGLGWPFPGTQPRGCVLSTWELVPGGCRQGTTSHSSHPVTLYSQEFCSQASRLSPGSPGHTCPPSSAPSLPCKAKNRGIEEFWPPKTSGMRSRAHLQPAVPPGSWPDCATPAHILSWLILGSTSSSHGHT